MIKYILLLTAISHSLFATTQVHVRDEPRHHNLFENEFIRILDVHLGPKDTTLYHLHNTPSVFIKFSNSNVGSQALGGQPQKGANISGEVTFDSLATPRTHRVWNEDTRWFHVMDVELKAKTQTGKTEVINHPYLKLLFNEQLANGYDLIIKKENIFKLPVSAIGYLLISMSAITIEYEVKNMAFKRILKPSHYLWVNGREEIFIKTAESQPANFVVLQLK